MGSESAAGCEIVAPAPYEDNMKPVTYEDGAINGETTSIDTVGFDGSESENKDAQIASTNGDAGSGWLNASPQDGNGSGWLSADGAPVTLPPSVPSQPWPSSRQHTLYLVKIPRSVDEKLRIEIKVAEAKLDQTIKKRDVHKAALQAKKNSKMELLEQLKPIREKERACRDALQGKRMELEPFSMALNKFKNVQNRSQDICSSEEELNEKIAEIQFRIQHESIPLREEKQLLREIKQLESTRSQVCANSVLQAELMENLGPREDIQDQAKLIRQDLDSIRKEHKLARAEYDALDKEINKLNEAIEELRQQYEKANAAQQDAFGVLRELKRQENLKNDPFYQNKRDVQVVRELAAQKKLKEVEDLCTKQVEDFMATWNKDSKYRAEYLKSNERSTVRRLETLDGRSLGPNEKPPVISDGDALLPKSRDAKPTPVVDAPAFKVSKMPGPVVVAPELSNGVSAKDTKRMPVHAKDEEAGVAGNGDANTKLRHMDFIEERADLEAQAAEQKEKLRQEQIAKAKEAEERKKKRSEKLELRALARAKKDAERKEKEREKKAQKKAGGSAPSVDPTTLDDGMDSNPSEQTEPAAMVLEEGVKNTPQSSAKDRKAPVVTRRKLPAKDSKASRPPLSKRSKKAALPLPIPIWAIASLAALVLIVALILFLKL